MNRHKVLALPLFLVLIVMTNSHGRSFFIDASGGSDSNGGDAAEAAWQSLDKLNATVFEAGDRILFKAGEKWIGSFTPVGSGNAHAPIVVDSYGEGDRPIIDGAGLVDHVIRLQDIDYWELNNLEITNYSESEGDRIGVFIVAEGGMRKHFRIRNLFIHHIMGRYTFEMPGKNTGGIGIIGKNDTRFDDILIENCIIGDLVRVGIFTNGNEGRPGDRPITNLVIRNNTIYRCAGDGVIVRYADKPLIEFNEAYENHNGPQELVKHGVALWCRSTDGAVFQYNHVYNTKGSKDGQAFDADLEARDTVVQYNFSHDNEGGFMLVYGSSSGSIVRYNISVNDGAKGGHIFDFPVWVEPRGWGIFHNNTIILPAGNDAVIADEAMYTARFYNNIFYHEGDGTLLTLDGTNRPYFKNNSFYGYRTNDVILDVKPIVGDPMLDAASGSIGSVGNPAAYNLSIGSPCFGTGTLDFLNIAYKVDETQLQEYPGSPLIIDVGAYDAVWKKEWFMNNPSRAGTSAGHAP
jgi:hypothetical protein